MNKNQRVILTCGIAALAFFLVARMGAISRMFPLVRGHFGRERGFDWSVFWPVFWGIVFIVLCSAGLWLLWREKQDK